MQAVVPAAGRGSRLRPLTDDRPKGLLEVAGTPLLTRVFDALAPQASEYVVVVGYRGDQIRDQYGEAYGGVPITYVEQPELRGLADAVRRTEPLVDGSFLQLNGDNVLSGGVAEVVETHRRIGADATVLTERVSRERATRGGVVVVEDGTPVRFLEKPTDPPSRLATTGCFAFSPRIFEAIDAIEPSDRGEYELPDAIEWLATHDGVVRTVRLDGWRVNVNTREDIERAERRL
jgi:glucose-1-phosphate thymidylyltransferase